MSREVVVVCFEKTHCERPQRYDQNHFGADFEKPISRSFIKSLVGDTLSKALEKSNCNNRVANFFSLATRMSSVNFIKAVCVEWCFLKPVWNTSRIFNFVMKLTTWSWANFSKTFERKHSKGTGLKFEGMKVLRPFSEPICGIFYRLQERYH